MEVLFVSTIIYPLIERKCTSTMLTALFVKKKKKKKERKKHPPLFSHLHFLKAAKFCFLYNF